MRNRLAGMSLLLVLMLALALLVAACGGQQAKNKPAPTPAPEKTGGQSGGPAGAPAKVTILGGAVGGVWSVISEGVGEALRRSLPAGSSVTVEPGKDGPNSVMVAQNEAELAVTYSVTAYTALQGTEPFKEKYPKVRAVALLNPNSAFHFVVKDAKFKTLDELKEKKYPLKISVNKQGSTMEVASKAVLNAYGITYEDIEKWGGKVYFLSTADTMGLIDNGQAEAHSIIGEYPVKAFVEGALKHKFSLLPIKPEVVEKVNQQLGTVPAEIPAGTYSFQPEAVPTLAASLMLITGADQPDDLVYNMTKALYEQLDYLKSVHATLKPLTAKDLPKTGNVPLHPGAEKFYREKGLLK